MQTTFVRALEHLDTFEPRHEGAFQAYLRRTFINMVFDASRQVQRRGVAEPLDVEQPATDASPLEEAIGQETLERYEAALERLKDTEREAIIMRINHEVADAITSRAVREKLTSQLMEPIPDTPAQFRARIDADLARWAPVIAAANIKIN